MSYAFQAILYVYIIETNVTHKRSYDGFHIKAEKLYKTSIHITLNYYINYIDRPKSTYEYLQISLKLH